MTSPDQEQTTSKLLSTARLLAALDTHGPKVAIYLLAAQLLGVFTWLQENAPGVCS